LSFSSFSEEDIAAEEAEGAIAVCVGRIDAEEDEALAVER